MHIAGPKLVVEAQSITTARRELLGQDARANRDAPIPNRVLAKQLRESLKLCLGIAVGKGRQQTVGGKVLTGAHSPQVTTIQSS